MYYRHVRGLPEPSNLLLLTRADGEFVRDLLQKQDPGRHYEANARFMGYEGADYGVCIYKCGKFIEWVRGDVLRKLCKDRPIVLQKDSWQSLPPATDR